MKRYVSIGVGVVLVVVVAVLFLGGNKQVEQTADQPAVSLDETSIQFVRPVVVGMRDGERQWEIQTENMLDRSNDVLLTDIKNGVLYRDGEQYVSFVADEGVWQQQDDVLDLHGNVKVYRDKQLLLETDYLAWDGRTEMLHAPNDVTIYHSDNTIRAKEMLGYVQEDELHFVEEVYVENERFTLFVTDKLVYRVEHEEMIGYGNGTLHVQTRQAGTNET